MSRYLDSIISIIKKEDFKIDDRITTSYLFNFFLRKALSYLKYMIKFKTFGLGFIGKRSDILSSSNINLGKNISIADDCYIDALSKEGIFFGNNVSIQKRVVIECTGSLKSIGKGLKVGNNVGIGSNSFLGCAGGVKIGSDTIIGNYVSIHSENHNYEDNDIPIRLQGVNHQGINIGENCWIGAKVTILDGTILQDGCIVAAGTVLNGKIYENNSIIAGVPGKVIKKRVKDDFQK